MSKKKKQGVESAPVTEAQKRAAKYYDACNKEKKGKALALSMIGITVVCLLVLLLVGLKLNGVTMMSNANGNIVSVIEVTENVTADLNT